MTYAYWKGNNPVRIIVSRRGELDRKAKIFSPTAEVLLFTRNPNVTFPGVKVIVMGDEDDTVTTVLKTLFDLEIQSLFVEGGSQIIKAFVASGKWDEARKVYRVLDELGDNHGSFSRNSTLERYRIYNVQRDDAFTRLLGESASFFCSDFIPDVAPGTEVAPRQYCQDLEKLSFADDFFDVVITEDVLEHVRDAEKAFREIRRVLKPRGCHFFTVPFLFDRETIVRIDTSTSEDCYLLSPEYHGDPIRGSIIAYRTFGIDMFGLLNRIGFETKVFFADYSDKEHGIFDSFVFCSRKN